MRLSNYASYRMLKSRKKLDSLVINVLKTSYPENDVKF